MCISCIYVCIKKFKNSTAKYYQKNKERLQKRSVKGI